MKQSDKSDIIYAAVMLAYLLGMIAMEIIDPWWKPLALIGLGAFTLAIIIIYLLLAPLMERREH